MGRLKHTVRGKTTEELAGKTSGRYTGKKPPKGIYRGRLRFFAVRGKKVKGKFQPQANVNGDFMLRGAVSIQETGAKAKFNGYLINFNQNVSDQGTAYCNQLLDAISGGSADFRKDFWANFVSVDPDGNITHIGKSRYADNSADVVVSAKDSKPNPTDGTVSLEVAAFLLKNAADTNEDEDEDEDDDTDSDLDVDVDADDEDEDDSEFEADDEVDEDDEPDEDDEDTDVDADEDGLEVEHDEDEEEVEEDEDEDADEESETEYPEAEKREEYNEMDRPALVAKAKGYGLKVYKSDDTGKLVDKIVDFEKEQPPF